MRKESEPAVENYSEESYVGNYGNLYITDAYFGVGMNTPYIQARFGIYRSIESTKTDWNYTRKSIFTCFAQTSDRLPRLTQTYPLMPDEMDMIESNID
ncbi:hypothetical protein TNCV_131991 [Trichonephila clavipes]|nr:hypothetical protein TNCV_131991 [Trichonephila clavipes]